ncbi:MAG: aminoglycoside phosphotransferase family protein [Betaproteobacteria bacterium]
MQPEALNAAFAALLGLQPGGSEPLIVVPFAASGNNRVFAVTAGEKRYAVKVYFRHPADTRDRLQSEYAFLTCAGRAGIQCVPRPVACDPLNGIGVYEYIDGRKLDAAEIDAGCVDQAARFILQLNHESAHAAGRDLPNASEACFSINEHFAMVDGRIARLAGIGTVDALDREAREFVAALAAGWQQAKAQILRGAQAAGIKPDEMLAERCISPSDFGFHNALATRDRGICFIDFEYAGWDDPAKLAGDFFSHPAVTVDAAYFDRFVETAMAYSPKSAALAVRARILLPVFQAKWCCIILNEFLPDSAQRRRFADPGRDVAVRKREQLGKAVALFERITT